MARLIAAIFLALAVGLSATACGKKGPPTLPEGQSDRYPHKYPRH